MKIDWKYLATTPGYKAIKAEMIRLIQQDIDQGKRFNRPPFRSKKEYHAKFNWIICRAKHYSIRLNIPLEEVLTQWEKKRTYSWLNYYQSSTFPLLSKGAVRRKSQGIKGLVKYYAKDSYIARQPKVRKIIKEAKHRHAVNIRKELGKKARWSVEYKKQVARRKRK